MPCGFHLAETVAAVGADADDRPAYAELPRSAGTGSSRSTDPPTSAGPGRGSSTGSSCWPRSSIRTDSSTSPRPGPGRRSRSDRTRIRDALPRAPSTACGAATAHACRGADDLEGWAQLCPDCVGKAGDNGFLRFRLRQALTERARRPTAGSTAASGAAGAAPTTAPAADAPTRRTILTPRCSPTTRRVRPSTTTGTCAAADTPAGRSTTRPGTPSSMPPGAGSTRLPIHGEIVELAAGTGWWSPLLAAQGRAVALRRDRRPARPRPRAAGRARAARPPPCPRRLGRARSAGRRRLHRVLAEPRPARPACRVPRARPALAQARRDRSPSSIRGSIRNRAPRIIRHRPTTPRSGGSTTAASSRSSRSTTSREELADRPRASPASGTPAVTTTGRFFLTGFAIADDAA